MRTEQRNDVRWNGHIAYPGVDFGVVTTGVWGVGQMTARRTWSQPLVSSSASRDVTLTQLGELSEAQSAPGRDHDQRAIAVG